MFIDVNNYPIELYLRFIFMCCFFIYLQQRPLEIFLLIRSLIHLFSHNTPSCFWWLIIEFILWMFFPHCTLKKFSFVVSKGMEENYWKILQAILENFFSVHFYSTGGRNIKGKKKKLKREIDNVVGRRKNKVSSFIIILTDCRCMLACVLKFFNSSYFFIYITNATIVIVICNRFVIPELIMNLHIIKMIYFYVIIYIFIMFI
jgi:hypothetical protein